MGRVRAEVEVALRRFLVVPLGFVFPLVIAVAWIPVRTRFPNTDLALILVVAVASVGALGRRGAVFAAAVSAALWFEFFDTLPFDRLGIARSPDLETTLVVAIVAVMAGELALRAARHRRAIRADSEQLTRVRAAAELVASGEDLVRVIAAVAEELTGLLDLESCSFEAPGESMLTAMVTRDGRLAERSEPVPSPDRPFLAGLPVVVQGEALGYFVLRFAGEPPPDPRPLLVAVTLADQVGAAFLAQAPPPLPPGRAEPLRGLRLLRPAPAHAGRGGPSSPAGPSASGQETAGLPSAFDRMIS